VSDDLNFDDLNFPSDDDPSQEPQPEGAAGDEAMFAEDDAMPALPDDDGAAMFAEDGAVPEEGAPDFSAMGDMAEAAPAEPGDGPDFGALADPAMAGISDDAVEDPLNLDGGAGFGFEEAQADGTNQFAEAEPLEADEDAEETPGVVTYFSLMGIHGLMAIAGLGGTGYLGYLLYTQYDSGTALSGLMWVTGAGLFGCLIMAIIGILVTLAIMKDSGTRVAKAWSEMGIYGVLMLVALFSLLLGTAFFGYELYRYRFDVGAETAMRDGSTAAEYLCDMDELPDHWTAA